MALIIEDGSEVANANSYVDDAEYVAHAAARGLSIGTDATAREIELIKAMDFIEGHRSQFKGFKVTDTQALQWPRSAVWIDTFSVNADEIPVELKRAQMEAAAAEKAVGLLKTANVSNVKREKVDVLETEFFSGGSWETARLDRVNVYLDQLLNNVMRVVRA